MQRIVAGIDTIKQHLEAIKQTPEAYRPPCCPHCGLKILWQHGHYERKADRRAGQDSLNPVPICRYCCSGCRRTCSRLPACIAPRRWYDWSVQQAVLAQGVSGSPHRAGAHGAAPERRPSGAPPVVGGPGSRSAACCSSFTCAPALPTSGGRSTAALSGAGYSNRSAWHRP